MLCTCSSVLFILDKTGEYSKALSTVQLQGLQFKAITLEILLQSTASSITVFYLYLTLIILIAL